MLTGPLLCRFYVSNQSSGVPEYLKIQHFPTLHTLNSDFSFLLPCPPRSIPKVLEEVTLTSHLELNIQQQLLSILKSSETMQCSLTLQKLLCWSGFISLEVACQIKLSVPVLDSWKYACYVTSTYLSRCGFASLPEMSSYVVDTF